MSQKRDNIDAPIMTLPFDQWELKTDHDPAIARAVESGKVLYFPKLDFELTEEERALLTPELVDPKRKNISYNADKKEVKGVAKTENEAIIRALLERYYQAAYGLVTTLMPTYKDRIHSPVNSLRVHSIDEWAEVSSWRKDDARLHVDAFPSRPMYGDRIMRVFVNINPEGVNREWRVGESFESLATRFMPRLKPYSSLSSSVQNALMITKRKRSHYDHIMLQMHDEMKADLDYQKNGIQWDVSFPPGSAWICYADGIPHAAMTGQYMLEQTFLLPVDAMENPELSPLKILEEMVGEPLI